MTGSSRLGGTPLALRSTRVVALAWIGWCSAFGDVPSARAQESAPVLPALDVAANVTADAALGQSTSTVQIWVPGFHELTPSMSLRMSTTARNGFVGTGATLTGWPTIERSSPRGGVPAYDARDEFVRDGQAMVPCASLPGTRSPSCVHGGTHTMEVETYERIELASDTFYVHRPDGTRLELAPLHRVAVGTRTETFRWGLTKVSDPRGNEARYAWACEGSPVEDCYPSEITYFPAGASNAVVSVRLYREARPDPFTFATGGASLGRTAKRLKSIEVRTAALLARAYGFSYASDSVTGRSFLRSVSAHGFDASVNASTGAITGGMTVPRPTTFTFDVPPSALGAETTVGRRTSSLGLASFMGDIDGNGTADFVYVARDTLDVHALRSAVPSIPNGTAPVATMEVDTTIGTLARAPVGIWLSDVTGDARADVVYLTERAGVHELWVAASDGTRLLPEGPTPWLTLGAAPTKLRSRYVFFLADINADGRSDVAYTTARQAFRSALSTGSGFGSEQAFTMAYPSGGQTNDSGWLYLVDVDGDAKADWVYNRLGTRDLYVKRAVVSASSFNFAADALWGSRASRTTVQTVVGVGAPTELIDPDTGSWADVNGDDKLDFVYVATSQLVECAEPCQSSFFDSCETLYGPFSECSRTCATTSTGGCQCFPTAPECTTRFLSDARRVLLSNGARASDDTEWGSALGAGSSLSDANGDGLADLLSIYPLSDSRALVRVALSNGRSFTSPAEWGTLTSFRGGATSVASELHVTDLNGDGKPDVLYVPPGTHELRAVQSTGAMAPVVSEVRNELGGTTRLRYAPSTMWPSSAGLPPMPTLVQLTLDDGRGAPGSISTESYTYAGGMFDAIRRRFLGFHLVTKTLPCIGAQTRCATEVTTYEQDYAGTPHPRRIDLWSGVPAGGTPSLLESTQLAYVTNGAEIPYTAYEVARKTWRYATDGTGAFRTQSQSRLCGEAPCVDAFGNVTQIVDYGFDDVAGDELTTVTRYVNAVSQATDPRRTFFRTGLPSRISVYSGVGLGTKLTEELHEYDGQPVGSGGLQYGELTRSLAWLDTASAYVPTRYGYDRFGNRTTVTDGNGATSTTVYDSLFTTFPIEVRNALYDPATIPGSKQRTLTTWETRCGLPRVVIDENDLRVTTTYDALCRVISIARPGGDGSAQGDVETREYRLDGSPGISQREQHVYVTHSAPNATGRVYSHHYVDGRGRSWQTRARGQGADVYTQKVFDARGNVVMETVPTAWGGGGAFAGNGPSREYDDLGRVLRRAHLDGSVVTFRYGASSTTSIDELGHVSLEERDARGNVTSQREQDGATVVTSRSTYDALGRRLRVTDPAGNVARTDVDSLGRVIRQVDPDLGSVVRSYDNVGRVVREVDAMGQVTVFEHDALGRLVRRVTRHDTPGAETATWGYDERYGTGFANMGRRTSAVDATSSQTFDYNGAGKITKHTRTLGGATYVTRSAYDVGGRLVGTRYPDGDVVGLDPLDRSRGVAHRYDDAGRLVGMTALDGTVLVRSASYDAMGSLVRQQNGNGTVNTFDYDSVRGWLRAVMVSTESGTTLFQISYVRDLEGKIVAINGSDARESWTFGYDALHRMTRATNLGASALSESYAYDTSGNITWSSRLGTYRYDGARGGCSGAYAPFPTSTAGTLPHAVSCTGAVPYTYDANGSMTSGAAGEITYDGRRLPVRIGSHTYSYDADGQRLRVTTPEGTTRFPSPGYEVTPSGVVIKNLSLGVQRRTSGDVRETLWIHSDGPGSTRVITNAAGSAVQRVAYRPYGEVVSRATTLRERAGFTGEQQDESGLVYMKARYYDPRIGRFIAADPTLSDGLNRYAYARNNPVSFVDRTGFGSNPWTDDYPFWWAGANDAFTRPLAIKLEARAQAGEIRPATFESRARVFWTGGATISGAVRQGSPQFYANMVLTLAMVTPIGEIRQGVAEAAFWGSERTTRELLATVRGTGETPGVVINLMTKGDRFAAVAERAHLERMTGTHSVVAHAYAEGIYGSRAEDVAQMLISNGYEGGPVCLFACRAGELSTGPAVQLQSILEQSVAGKVTVWATDAPAYMPQATWYNYALGPNRVSVSAESIATARSSLTAGPAAAADDVDYDELYFTGFR